jgi:hypothetical protein
MSKPLGLNLGVDFADLDRQLNTVANRIESVGKQHAIKIGAAAGDISTGKLSGGDLAASVSQAGQALAAGMASGIRSASSLMLGFTARISQMLDKLTGSAITLFRRIDAAMKFPTFDAFFRSAQLKLANFGTTWKKPLSDMDLALGGAFGGMVKNITRVLKALIDGLAAAISGALKDAVASVAAEFAKVTAGAMRSEAAAKMLVGDMQDAVKVSQQFAKFPAMGGSGLKTSIPGPKIGTGTQFTSPAAAAPASAGFGAKALAGADIAMKAIGNSALAAGRAVNFLVTVTAKAGSALVSVPLAGYIAFRRLGNFLSSLGDVGKSSYRKLYESHGLVLGSILAVTKGVTGLASVIFHVGTLGVFRKAGEEATMFGRNVQAAGGMVKKLGSIVTSTFGQIVGAFGFIGLVSGVVNFFKAGIAGAADLNETVAASKVIFGTSFGPVQAQADAISKHFGVMRNDQLRIAAGFGSMAQGAGMTEAASARMANQMTEMTLNFAATWKMPIEQAAEAIRSGLAGQGRALKQYGVFIDEDTTKAVALAQGARLVNGELSKQDAIAARAAIVMNGLSYATGALERTSGGAAAQFRKAGGGIGEFGVRIGELLLPAVTLATEGFNTLLEAALNFLESSMPVIQSWSASFTAAMDKVGMVSRNLGPIWQIAQLRIGEFAENSVRWLEVLPENFGRITGWLGRNWLNLMNDFIGIQTAAFSNLLANAQMLGEAIWNAIQGKPWALTWKPLLDGFKASTEQLPAMIKPALINVDQNVSEIWKGIEDKEAARKKALANATAAPKKPMPIGEAEKKPDYKLASAVEIGSKEASSIIARSTSAGARQGALAAKGVSAQQQTAANTAKMLDYQKSLAALALADRFLAK